MAYFDDTNSPNSYSASDFPGELNFYPSLAQTSATEEVGSYTYPPFPDWLVRQPGPVVGSPTSVWATGSCEPVASATSYAAGGNGYSQPLYPEQHWSAAGQQAQYHHPDPSSWDISLNAGVPEALTIGPTPSVVPLDYWGANQSGPFDSAFHVPYVMARARLYEHRNAEAGPSTLMLPPTPYVDQRRSHPPGGISETTADAVTTNQITEEDRVTEPKRTRLPHGRGRPRPSCVVSRSNGHKLCDWVQRRRKLPGPPTLNQALAVAVEIISKRRHVVYQEPRLKKGKSERTAAGSQSADEERERRDVERGFYRELSRYYPLGRNQKVWYCPPLLLRVLKDLERLPALPEPSSGSQT